jgi:tight adherence protein C
MSGLWIAFAAAVAVTILAASIGRRLPAWWVNIADGRRSAKRAAEVPKLLRLLLPISEPVAVWLGPRLPTTLRESLQRRLRLAGIDETVLPQQWLAVCGASALIAAAIGGIVVSSMFAVIGVALIGAMMPMLWMRDAVTRRAQEVIRDLPVYVDMLTLTLEAGGALSVALKVATDRAPDGVLRRAFMRVQGDLRAGRSRREALLALGERLSLPAVDPLVAALVQAESSGASLATVLRAQADQRLHERFARAEKLALEAPVKMLGPLVLCIFPCTFLVLAFPLVMRFLGEG